MVTTIRATERITAARTINTNIIRPPSTKLLVKGEDQTDEITSPSMIEKLLLIFLSSGFFFFLDRFLLEFFHAAFNVTVE